ncbi:PEP/pyruvate-binding domain-containing protein [Undibacterium sp. Ji67W]|uniref:PEP/pyruvate-binding domain-containing protein n=1 Tax=Undibacterium sp. Ji67W TaxID=3413042 RepID=UPI003BF0D52B
MTSSTHWPKHFFLISGNNTDHHFNHKPSRESMGTKAYNLLRMTEIGLQVPPALVIGTDFSHRPEECFKPLFDIGLPALQNVAGEVFGDIRNPLIVSVRSGASVSMPGMMETILNVGISDATLSGFLRKTGNPRLVWDAYRHLVACYGEVVSGVPASIFENEIAIIAQGRDERELDFSELRALTKRFLAIYQEQVGQPFPQDVHVQLTGAIHAVFASWLSDKADTYRHLNKIDAAIGTAVTIQSMAFGNSGAHSGAGVGFTRDPTTGEQGLWVDFLSNAQGEDVVSGRRNADANQGLATVAPAAWQKLQEAAQALEQEFSDMQDFEFTVQDGVLYMLQSRSGKRTPLACARIALDLLDENIIDTATALQRTEQLKEEEIGTIRLSPQHKTSSDIAPLAKAASACPGVVSGKIVLDAQSAAEHAKGGVSTILVRQDAETSDIAALDSAAGLLTERGARTSHAAVVARQLGKVCLVGCDTLRIDMTARTVSFAETTLHEGDIITLDGNEGVIYHGKVAAVLIPDEALLKRLRALRKSAGTGHHGRREK